MELSGIEEEWKKDSKIDFSNLDMEALKVSELHSKYYKIYLLWKDKKRLLKSDYKKLMADKTNWYMGLMSLEEMKKRNWEPYPIAIKNNKSALEPILQKDEDLNDIIFQLEEIDDITDYIKSIIEIISKRNFSIKNAIDWRKFLNGQ